MSTNKQNILIISRTIHPNLAPRSHRATELAKELAKEGHQVTLCAVLGDYDYSDLTKTTGIKVDNLGVSPFEWWTSDVEKRELSLWKKGIVFLLRRWVLFPDCLVGLRTRKYLKNHGPFDRIITIAVPYPIHFGTGYAKRHFAHLKSSVWISDCGDPFTGSPFSKYPFYFKWVEKKWCRTTDFISIPTTAAVDGYYPEFRDKIRIIPQGFRFNDVDLATYVPNPVPTFAYSGMVYPDKRDPRAFLNYLSTIDTDFKFIVYSNKPDMFEAYKQVLGKKLELRDYVPRNQLLHELSIMDFLINIKNESTVQVPSKIIDYYQTKRPILEITSRFDEKKEFEEFLSGNYNAQLIIENPKQYDIVNVCHQFLELL